MAKAHMMGGGKGKGKGAAGRYAGLSTVGNMTANYNHHRREYAIMMRSKGGKGEGERRDEWQSKGKGKGGGGGGKGRGKGGGGYRGSSDDQVLDRFRKRSRR